jgi:anti-sigma factor (TIGR02949 family)
MKDCGDNCTNIRLYLDDELIGQDLEEFSAHLESCVPCKKEVEAERELSRLLRRSRPLYSASDTLRARIIAASAQLDPAGRHASIGLGRRIAGVLPAPSGGLRVRSWGALAAMVLLVAVGSLFLPGLLRRSRAAGYVEAAVVAHRGLLDGSLPLEVQTESPKALTAWFTGKVPFLFRLPDSVNPSGEERAYRLVGGRLVTYKGEHAALVAYQVKQQRVSLLVASSRSATAAGGEEVPFGGIVFHYNKRATLNIIVWSNRGLTYALVSSLPGNGRESCLVCHQSMGDGARFTAQQ